MTVFVTCLWMSRTSVYRILIVFAVILLLSIGPTYWHQYLAKRLFAQDGFRLVRFELWGGFGSRSYDWPWWVEHYTYCAEIAVDGGDVMQCDVWVQGSFFGMIAPKLHFCVYPYSWSGGDCDREVALARLRQLRQLKSLRNLDLGCSSTMDDVLETLGEWDGLESLKINHAEITDRGIASLNQLTQLRDLQLYDTKTTAGGREALRKALPNCTITPEP